MRTYPRVLPAGDSCFLVEFGEAIDPAINDRVLACARAVEKRSIPGVIEVVPTYCSLAVYVDPILADAEALKDRLGELARSCPRKPGRVGRTVRIPVLYGGAFGPDLAELAARASLSPEDVIALHTSIEYRVYMLGFSPGFPYLGTVPEQIAAPRLAEPRTIVPAGSVGIAGSQTGIYPQESPGGWRLIGRTPVRLYDLRRKKPFLLEAGDRVRFVAISRQDYEHFDANRFELRSR